MTPAYPHCDILMFRARNISTDSIFGISANKAGDAAIQVSGFRQ